MKFKILNKVAEFRTKYPNVFNMKLALFPKYFIRRFFVTGKKNFFRAGYKFLYPEYSRHGMSPWQHYVIDGKRKGFCDGNCPPASVFFREGYELEYPDVKAAGIDPWHHYVQNGLSEKRDNGLNPPQDLFFAAGYLAMYPDVAESKEDPWHHYVLKGKAEGRDNGFPKVSVVIPVYNVEKYLRECLESVVNQTLKAIEIICVNDGSTDGSLGILNEYAGRDGRIKVISQTNQGAGAARNAGLNVAVGTYLAVLDADDRYDLSLLEKMYGLAVKDSLDIAVCRSHQLDNRAGVVFETPWTIHEEMLPKKKVFSYKDLSSYVFRFCIGWSWDKLFRRDFVEQNHLRFQTLRSQNDALFVFVSLAMAERIEVLGDVLVTHRVNTGTQVSELRDRNPACFIEAVRGIKQALEERNRFNEVEQGFDNWCAEHTNWQLSTLSPSSQLLIYYDLVSMLRDIKLLEKPAEFFDAKQDEQLKKRLRNMKRCIALLTPKQN